MLRYVFVCKHGESRSLRAARIAQELLTARGVRATTDYFGVEGTLANEEQREIIRGADHVFVMERDMIFNIRKVLRYRGPIDCLELGEDVPDSEFRRRVEDALGRLHAGL